MSWFPPNVSTQSLTPGTHEVYLTDIKPIDDPAKLVKFAAQAVFIATYKSVETAVEIDSVIKFSGSKADYYAGQTIDRLHLAAGLEEPAPGTPLDLTTLILAIEGKVFLVDVNDKGYVNGIIIPVGSTGTEEAF